ncbi:cation-dependent mannose-6-phosphate receptor-like [Ylistrum balloti]|uniref:cation-dependent mannose-6-phosphate receptor-like n=1 Tax=Ylistrum balloti TaxID=509963 RepID=UPI002905BE3A|nr:cation-dependent mannose-6-phosphate receptor-like [Ylistrum balloti]
MNICVLHIILLLWVALISAVDRATAGCSFPQHTSENRKIEAKIQPLLGKRFRAEDVNKEYVYKIGICTDALDKTEFHDMENNKNIGVYQFKYTDGNLDPKDGHVVGRYNNTSMTQGTGWILLEYRDGEKYHTHCTQETRRARIMIICDEDVDVGSERINIFEENTNKTGECYYLFEMASSAACRTKPAVTFGLSLGSILVIVFVSVVFLYLLLGIAYQRFVLGAKGMEQLPNYSFWQDFGNLQSDGCNLVCRSGGSPQKPTFKGLGDDQLQEEDDRDDHLLPM